MLEYGKLLRTLHALRWFTDEAFRRRIGRQLNRGEAMIATDAEVLSEARQVAAKLGVQLFFVPAGASPPRPASSTPATSSALTFGCAWAEQVAALQGRTLSGLAVAERDPVRDGAGITRRTSNGRVQHIDIEIFRWAIEHLLSGGTVTREEINENYDGGASSGITLIIALLPLFELVRLASLRSLRPARGAEQLL